MLGFKCSQVIAKNVKNIKDVKMLHAANYNVLTPNRVGRVSFTKFRDAIIQQQNNLLRY